jgi:hypothetical protein
VIEHYEQQAAAHAARRDEEARRSMWIARARLATFIPGLAAVIWALSHSVPMLPLAIGVALLAAFAALVVWHARVEDRRAWFDALHTVNMTAMARIARAWDRLPAADAPVASVSGMPDIELHPYALDLDVFGRASLMQWLGPPATASGGHVLHEWLLQPAVPVVVQARHGAVVALASAVEWREHLAAHGRLAGGVRQPELERFLNWTQSAGPFTIPRLRLLRAAVLVLTISIWLFIGLQSSGVVDGAYWLVPLVAGMVLSFVTALHVHGEFDRAGAGQQAFQRYTDLFVHATAAPDSAPLLQRLLSRLSADGLSAPHGMRRLNRIVGFAALRQGAGIFHFLVQVLTLWDFHVFFALDRWRRTIGPAVPDWMSALGELDALSAFAQVKADNPSWCLPVLTAEKIVEAENLGHPLLHDDRRVGNDVTIGPPGTLLLITGSNMSGKSTLLRAIGLNTVLAQAGAPVCAAALRLPPVHLETCIRVQDSLEHGLSYFMAALARLKGVIDRSRAVDPTQTVLYLLDEILQGTNTAERAVAVRGVARHLLACGAIGVMTTHDLALAAEEPLKSGARLAHFTELVDEHGGMTFDYRLRPGLATSRNALRLMHLIGLHLEDPLVR